MIIRIAIALVALALLLYLGRWATKEYKKKGRPFAVKALLVTVALVFVSLAATGKVHWLGALMASLLAGLRFALPLLLRSAPFIQQIYRAKASQQQSAQNHSHRKMSAGEAIEVLGLSEYKTVDKLNRQIVVDAHRKLIQKLHPDRGGNDYLAAQLNLAKSTLLEIIED